VSGCWSRLRKLKFRDTSAASTRDTNLAAGKARMCDPSAVLLIDIGSTNEVNRNAVTSIPGFD
jgi:hypothetical protein